MQLATTREVTSIDKEQRTTDRTLRQRIQNNSFLHRYPEKGNRLDLRYPEFNKRSSQTAVLAAGQITGLLSTRPGLLLLAYNYIQKHNITNNFAVNWVQNFERGCFR
jgi:hypothetical protein